MVQIWWAYLERVMSYRADNLNVIDTHMGTQAMTITEGKNWPRVKNSHCAEYYIVCVRRAWTMDVLLPLAPFTNMV